MNIEYYIAIAGVSYLLTQSKAFKWLRDGTEYYVLKCAFCSSFWASLSILIVLWGYEAYAKIIEISLSVAVFSYFVVNSMTAFENYVFNMHTNHLQSNEKDKTRQVLRTHVKRKKANKRAKSEQNKKQE